MSEMSATERIRRVYMILGEQCTQLAELGRQIESPLKKDKIEEIRQQVASARMSVWVAMRDGVMREWCNETDTPEPFSKYPPKDMPTARGRGERREGI